MYANTTHIDTLPQALALVDHRPSSPSQTAAATATSAKMSSSLPSSPMTSDVINQLSVLICTVLVIVGCVSNLVSFMVFVKKSSRVKPKIITKHLLIVFTISNSFYLILYWYYSVFPKIIDHLRHSLVAAMHTAKTATTTTATVAVAASATSSASALASASATTMNNTVMFMSSLYLVNSNVFFCKSVSYLISVTLCLNAFITVFFSLERAIAINFPLQMRAFRESHRSSFNILVAGIVLVAFVFPIYNLKLVDVIEIRVRNNSGGGSSSSAGYKRKYQCDIPEANGPLYFYMTIVFVVVTLAIPFVLITVSNASILFAIYKNTRHDHILARNAFAGGQSSASAASAPAHMQLMQQSSGRMVTLSPPPTMTTTTTTTTTNMSHGASFPRTSSLLSRRQHNMDKNKKITNMLLSISASFVLFNLPYFVAWCIFAKARIAFQQQQQQQQQHSNSNGGGGGGGDATQLNLETTRHIAKLFGYVKITEIFNLFNYAVTGFLYFATGKIYRQHLYSMVKCSRDTLIQKSSSVILSNNKSKS